MGSHTHSYPRRVIRWLWSFWESWVTCWGTPWAVIFGWGGSGIVYALIWWTPDRWLPHQPLVLSTLGALVVFVPMVQRMLRNLIYAPIPITTTWRLLVQRTAYHLSTPPVAPILVLLDWCAIGLFFGYTGLVVLTQHIGLMIFVPTIWMWRRWATARVPASSTIHSR